MKKFIYIAASLFLTITMQAQDRPQPKPGPAPSININKPQSFVLKNGLKVLVVENHKLPRVSFNLTLDNAPYAEGSKKGVSDILSSMIGNGTQSKTKDAFNEEIDFLGANIDFYASGASANGLSRYAKRILELMADGAMNPLFVQDEFDKEKAKIIEGLKSDEKSVTAIARRVENVLTYGKDHYKGEFTSEETLKNVTLEDVVNNYNTYFVPANAYLVIVGDVQFKKVKKEVEKLFGKWKAATAPQPTYTDPKDVQYSQINFIDTPNAVQSEIALVNLTNLKMTDKEYFAVLLANQVLGGGGEGRLFLNLREKHGWTYGAYSSIGSGKYINKFRSGSSVRNAVTDSAVVEVFNELKKMRSELVSEEDLRNAKAKYVGNFVMQIEKPSTIAGYALNKETQGLPEDFYENYIKNINAITAEDIRNAANKFFLADQTRVIIVGKAGDVLPGLETMSKREKLPIFYFDKYGNPTKKPELKKPTPAGVTAQTILNDYIKAIGGEKAVKNVKTVSTISSGTVQGMALELNMKNAPKKLAVEMKANGMSMMKQIVNEKGAYAVQQGKRKDYAGEELLDMQAEANTFKELALLTDKEISVTGIEYVNGTEAYALKNGKSTLFYDVKTGLKIAESKEVEQRGQKMEQTTYYLDYKDVKGLKFPYKIVMNVGLEIELTTTEVKINEGVTDADFK
jgi:zinc protease